MRICIACAAVAASVAACTVHPIPADVIQLSVYDIAQKLRCEAREAVAQQYAARGFDKQQASYNQFNLRVKDLREQFKSRFGARIATLEAERKDLALRERRVNAEIERLKDLLREISDAALKDKNARSKRENDLAGDAAAAKRSFDELKMWVARKRALDRRVYQFNRDVVRLEQAAFYHEGRVAAIVAERTKNHKDLQRFLGNTLAFALRFEIEETNDTRLSSSDFTWPVTSGTVTLGLAAGDKRLRKGRREIRVVSGFEELLLEKDCGDAKGLEHTPFVHRYPMRGRIGLDEVIDQYLVLQKEVKLKASFDTAPTYRSVITFTTTIDGSIKPGITLTRAPGRRFSGGSTILGQRQDLHEATVVLEPPAEPKEGEREKTINVRILNNRSLLEDGL